MCWHGGGEGQNRHLITAAASVGWRGDCRCGGQQRSGGVCCRDGERRNHPPIAATANVGWCACGEWRAKRWRL